MSSNVLRLIHNQKSEHQQEILKIAKELTGQIENGSLHGFVAVAFSTTGDLLMLRAAAVSMATLLGALEILKSDLIKEGENHDR